MKRKFLQVIAVLLCSLAIVTIILPEASVKAEGSPNIKVRYDNVYEGMRYTYQVKNATGYSIEWALSGKGADYARLSKNSGNKTVLSIDTKGAMAAKNAKLVVSAKFYKNKKLIKTSRNAVIIRINAKAVAITTKDDLNSVIIGQLLHFESAIAPVNANGTTYWRVTDEAGEETAAASIDATGNFTASKAGTYIVIAEAKDDKKDRIVANTSQKVIVTPSINSIKADNAKEIKITFNDDVDLYTAGLEVFYSISINKGEPLDKKSESAFKACYIDPKTVLLQLVKPLSNQDEYTVEIDGVLTKELKKYPKYTVTAVFEDLTSPKLVSTYLKGNMIIFEFEEPVTIGAFSIDGLKCYSGIAAPVNDGDYKYTYMLNTTEVRAGTHEVILYDVKDLSQNVSPEIKTSYIMERDYDDKRYSPDTEGNTTVSSDVQGPMIKGISVKTSTNELILTFDEEIVVSNGNISVVCNTTEILSGAANKIAHVDSTNGRCLIIPIKEKINTASNTYTVNLSVKAVTDQTERRNANPADHIVK